MKKWNVLAGCAAVCATIPLAIGTACAQSGKEQKAPVTELDPRADAESRAFARFFDDFKAAEKAFSEGKPADVQALMARFEAHAKQYAAMSIIHQRADEIIKFLGGAHPELPRQRRISSVLTPQQWSELYTLRYTPAQLAERKRIADETWKELEGGPLRDAAQAIAKYGKESTEYYLWESKRRLDYRSAGLGFSMAFSAPPGDPRRFRWLIYTTAFPPFFWQDEKQGADAYSKGTPELALVNLSVRESNDLAMVDERGQLLSASDENLRAAWQGEKNPPSGAQLRAELRTTEYLQAVLDAKYAVRRGDFMDFVPLMREIVDQINHPDVSGERAADLARSFVDCTQDVHKVRDAVLFHLRYSRKPAVEAVATQTIEELQKQARKTADTASAAP